ncbi:hybrid sensor histidine kinase/response regulator [Enhygromyxa salina]|uniref:histidine kinase n=1 Tax=Enhygromyxa salina TaxID=215803 RepID=A0A2S9YJX7_9BACT|nr:hybrid sensor histidine kinase/response regulator [Enhygromyxa salina]PRQ05407.1 Sensor histidine kinase YycG [Enhygromyxa salina]
MTGTSSAVPPPLRVIVIDDDEIDRMAARRILEQLPLRVSIEEFESGETGLARLLAGDVDCVLLDYSLPGFDGFEVLARLDAAQIDVPVIMMTGIDGDEQLIVEALRNGAYDYLSKSRLQVATLWSKIRAVRRLHGARSQIRAAQTKLHSTIAQLRQAVAARDSVLAVVSHDLRGPLNNIQLSLGLLEADDPAARRMAIDSIERAVSRSNRLISDLLDVSQFESGGFELQLASIDARALVHSAVSEVAALAGQTRNELLVEIDEALAPVHGDRERLLQVLDNLLRNALKYGPNASELRVRVRVCSDDPRHAEFSVSDRGPGIDERDRGQVFERFWQADSRAKSSGSGLGLAIAKSIVEAHGGQIGVDQAIEGGARFYFTLPFVHAAKLEPPHA